MSTQSFSLVPFQREDDRPDLAITGTIGRSADTLSIGYAVAGNLSALAVPAAAESPERKDRLWEDTCLELFLGVKGSDGYREFNLSPAGHWNVYRFTSYRKGMMEEPAFASLPFDVRRDTKVLLLAAEFNIGKIVPATKDLAVTVAAVIKTIDGGKSHWALAHPASRPDFHRRDGFTMILPCSPGM